jgi:uncharacterized protein (DUF2252 family)
MRTSLPRHGWRIDGEQMHTTPAEQIDGVAGGKAARARAPRTSHAYWSPSPDRPDPRALLAQDDATRVPELVPIRYGRMLRSPFTFFRGAAAIMAADLPGTPTSGFEVQLCGDAHLSNFGTFAAPDRRLVFDLNDFDETAPGPWEWDVKRLVASVAVAGRAQGLSERERGQAVRSAGRGYRKAMRRFAAMGTLELWYARGDVEALLQRPPRRLTEAGRRAAQRNVDKARSRTSLRAAAKLTHEVDGRRQIINAPPLIVRMEELLPAQDNRDMAAAVRGLLDQYRGTLSLDRARLLDGYRPVDVARKVVGVGSVGTRVWIVLMEGRDAGDPLMLQVKEAGTSVLESHFGSSGFDHGGQRVVEGQRLMQATGDIFLGWLRAVGLDGAQRDFYVRQLWDGKGSADVDNMDAGALFSYAKLCGAALARAHARSGDRVAIAAYLGDGPSFERALAAFAETYADQNERDYAALYAHVKAGEIKARSDL